MPHPNDGYVLVPVGSSGRTVNTTTTTGLRLLVHACTLVNESSRAKSSDAMLDPPPKEGGLLTTMKIHCLKDLKLIRDIP